MFYSHEILTNRQYGVATIWLVATLGAKSNLKKITRRAIIDVDLQKACKTITEPEVPLALRLQGSLLFGVSRVFQQQCGYVLTDVTSLRDNMKTRAPILEDMELDPDVGKTRPEQLNLALDPYFLPEIDINFDLSAFDFPPDRSSPSRDGSSLLNLPSIQNSLNEDEGGGGFGLDIDIPSFNTPGVGVGGFDLLWGAGTSSAAKASSRADRLPSIFGEEPAIIDDPVFDVGDDGFLHPAMSGDPLGELEMPSIEGQPLGRDTGASSRAGTEILPAAVEGEPMLNLDDEIVFFDDDEPALTPTAPLIPLTPEPDGGEEQQARRLSSAVQPSEESSETAEAPHRRVRTVKAIQPDQETELTNRSLNEWNQNYLANMAVALRNRQKHLTAANAKKNADFWVHQQGLGNVASTFGIDREPHPLAIFSGHSLWDLLGGPARGTKRSHTTSVTDEQEEEERRVRAKTTTGEGNPDRDDGEVPQFDDGGLVFNGDDLEIEAEVGRHAPPSLPDHPSGMPWNASVGWSRQGSVNPPGSGLIPGLSSSVGGLPGGVELGSLPSLSRRGSRLTSASPLFGKGLPSLSGHSSQGPQDPSCLTSNEDQFADLDAQLGAGLDPDFELYGPSATVDTQTAAQSQWVAATLENEAYNFLTFVTTKIQEKRGREREWLADEEIPETQEESIMFDDLLPPTENSAIVGAQALLHVLALKTKGLLGVYQAEHFGDIQLSVTSH